MASGRSIAEEAPAHVPFPAAPALLITAAGAVLSTIVALARPETIPLALTPIHLTIIVSGIAFLFVVVRHPGLALPLLVAFIYLNLSEVLVRFHGFPSVLQLIALPLFFAAWLGRGAAGLLDVLTRRLTIFLLAYTLAIALSTTWARSFELADDRLTETAKSFLLFLLMALLLTSFRRFEQACFVLAASAVILSLLPIIQIAGAGFSNEFGGLARIKYAHIYGNVFQPRIAGPLGDPNFFAQILLIAVPFALFLARGAASRRLRLLGGGAVLIILAAILLSYSRGAMLALIVMTFITLIVLRVGWKRMLAGGILFAAALVLVPRGVTERFATIEEILPGGGKSIHPDSSFEKRKLLTAAAWAMFVDRPLTGVGAGNYTLFFDEYAANVGSVSRDYEDAGDLHYPHNLYLEIGAESGLPALMAMFAAVATFFISVRRARKRLQASGLVAQAGLLNALEIAMTGYLISSLFLHGDFQRYLWLLFALGLAAGRLAPMLAAESREGARQ